MGQFRSPVTESPPLWFSVQANQLRERADPGYAIAAIEVNQRYSLSAYPLIRLGDLLLRAQYGSSVRPQATGDVRVVRMNNLVDGRLDLADHKWLTLDPADIERYLLEPGDVLFNRTNSKERVGKSAVFSDEGSWVFASYLIRMSVNRERVTPEFLATFLSSPSGRLQIDRDSRQIIGMANVNSAELRRFQIPLPPLNEQRRLSRPVEQAWKTLDSARVASRDTDSEINRALLRMLDVRLGDPTDLQTFSVAISDLRGQRLDALAYVPIVQPLGHDQKIPLAPLGEIVEINPKRPAPREYDDMTPYVGLPECSQVRVERVILRDRRDPIGRNVAIAGDILFARIEPSVFNRKYVLVRNLGEHESVLTSAEFFVIRPQADMVDEIFLHEVLLSDIIAEQIAGKTTGSSGRRRLDRDVLATLAIPLPELPVQQKIAKELRRRRRITEQTLADTEDSWRKVMGEFELALFDSP
jgi:type I restriction enzyme, S subunit